MEDGHGQHVQLLSPTARDLLARLRPMAIVREHAGAAKADTGLWAGPRYTTHPLVREVAAEMLASRNPEERMQACRAFAHFMLSCGEEMTSVARISMEAQVVAQELLSMELVNFRELARLLTELACKILSPKHPRPLIDLAALLWDLGQLVAAAELGRATLKALEPNHSELLYARACLEFMLNDEATLVQAENLARQKLDGLSASLGKDHADTVNARENLALTLLQWELFEAAQPAKVRKDWGAWSICGNDPEFKSDQIRDALGTQARKVYGSPKTSSLTEGDEVVKLQWEVLQAREAAQGPDHPDTIFARASLAATLCQRGQLDRAAELLRSVMAAQVQLLGEQHPDTARTRTELTKVLERSNVSMHAIEAGYARRSGSRQGMGWANGNGLCSWHMKRHRDHSTLALSLRHQTWQPRSATAVVWINQQSSVMASRPPRFRCRGTLRL